MGIIAGFYVPIEILIIRTLKIYSNDHGITPSQNLVGLVLESRLVMVEII
jgi:hypothetical protein